MARPSFSLRSGALVTGVVLAGALGLAACSSSPSNSASNTTTTAGGSGVGPSTTVTAPPGSPLNAIASIPAADRSPAGTAGTAPTVTVPSGTPPTQLESADLITGTGAAAASGDPVTVQYVLATYSSGKVIQSSWTSQPFTFTLGHGQVIPGWDKGVVGMKVGGRRELIIPPNLGYGAQSPGAGIAANDTLVFVIDLQKIG
ncbi:MAG TPA: FKBP-type peptidyl-prolyl cis-trans isomerase [Acidimicrobiales bacterium]|jgi:peptidylprolyl isomerase|nr:FKBP-type peptidyl-prolyl cis-trans isomerase [Acidimicrobiales bacterium]